MQSWLATLCFALALWKAKALNTMHCRGEIGSGKPADSVLMPASRRVFCKDAASKLLQSSFGAVLLTLPAGALAEEVAPISCAEAASISVPALKQRLPPAPSGGGAVRLVLCRHGQTELNRLGKVQGRAQDPPLNDTGRAQARRLARALRGLPVAAVASSPLRRARETAAYVAAEAGGGGGGGGGGGVLVLDDLNEVDFGRLGGGDVAAARASFAATNAAWARGDLGARHPGGGESAAEVLARSRRGVATLLQAAAAQQAAAAPAAAAAAGAPHGRAAAAAAAEPPAVAVAVAHSGLLKLLLADLLGRPLLDVRSLGQENCCINVLEPTHPKEMAESVQKNGRLVVNNTTLFSFSMKQSPHKDPLFKSLFVNDCEHLKSLTELEVASCKRTTA